MNNDVLAACRERVSHYCSACGAQCCRNGRLTIKQEVLAVMTSETEGSLTARGLIVREWDGSMTLDLKLGCLALTKHNTCACYGMRPQACRDFPFFLFGNNIVLGNCPPLMAGKLDAELKQLRDAGFCIV